MYQNNMNITDAKIFRSTTPTTKCSKIPKGNNDKNFLNSKKQYSKILSNYRINILKNDNLSAFAETPSEFANRNIILNNINNNFILSKPIKAHFRHSSINYTNTECSNLSKEFEPIAKSKEKTGHCRTNYNSYKNSREHSLNNSFHDKSEKSKKSSNDIVEKLSEKFSKVNEKIKRMKEKIKLNTSIVLQKVEKPVRDKSENKTDAMKIIKSNDPINTNKILKFKSLSKNISINNSPLKFSELSRNKFNKANLGSKIMSLKSEHNAEENKESKIEFFKPLVEPEKESKKAIVVSKMEPDTVNESPTETAHLLGTIEILKNYIQIQKNCYEETINTLNKRNSELSDENEKLKAESIKVYEKNKSLSEMILNLYHKAKIIDNTIKKIDNENLQTMTQLLEENKILRKVCENEISNKNTKVAHETITHFFDNTKASNKKAFDETVCYKKEETEFNFNEEEIDNLKPSMIKKLCLYKSKPKLFLFHTNNKNGSYATNNI